MNFRIYNGSFLFKITEIVTTFSRNFEVLAVQKYATLVNLEKMLQNASFLAIVAVDTAENERLKNLR